MRRLAQEWTGRVSHGLNAAPTMGALEKTFDEHLEDSKRTLRYHFDQ